MAAFLRWAEKNNQAPIGNIRDRLNLMELHDDAEFLSRYWFSKETVEAEQEDWTNMAEKEMQLYHQCSNCWWL